ncbi:hypothetical protein SYNPS1DRAFT_26926 [Syncephalis pseudoplumigaleata]|uniref:Uncharacterized protein n=1 Tax=Syncephalis pseudoplumigaleata TaxID=1712513 RepID=A0A4P9Z5R2_9FUNG|nr:hypothetical protein SYNPS1DRAFT_26926 [Syncephalis pseudoplumigaleata]|eukprot:RKP27422.1 hypothetical protein SYNPS1DRAFT_26926 [Syncephalis pseudoplumigaleata]
MSRSRASRQASAFMLLCIKRASIGNDWCIRQLTSSIARYLEAHPLYRHARLLTEYAGQCVVAPDHGNELVVVDGQVQPVEAYKLLVPACGGSSGRVEHAHLTSSAIVGKMRSRDGTAASAWFCAWRGRDSLPDWTLVLDGAFRLVDTLDNWALLGEPRACTSQVAYTVCSLLSGRTCSVFVLERSAACHLQKASRHHVHVHSTVPCDDGRLARRQLWRVCINGVKQCIMQDTVALPSTGGHSLVLTRRIGDHAVLSQFWADGVVGRACHMTFHCLTRRRVSWGRAVSGDGIVAILGENGAVFASGTGQSCDVFGMADGATLRRLRFPTACYLRLDLGFVAHAYACDDDHHVLTMDLRHAM